MINFCFKKQNHLQKSSDFKLLSSKGQQFRGQFFITIYKRNGQQQINRLGITVSKKCSKRAVDRNRLKRLIRESFRLNQQQFNAYDVVVIGRRLAVSVSNEELFNELSWMWQKLVRYCN